MPMTRRTLPIFLAALLAAVGLASLVAVPPATATGKIHCRETTGAAAVDPLVHHNQPRAMVHVHQFFGNDSWLPQGNSADYEDLLGKKTNCDNQADTAGYWVPQLKDGSGKPVAVQAFLAYYRPFSGLGGPDFGEGHVIPADTRLVATRYDWGCGEHSDIRAVPRIPSCVGESGRPGSTLTAHVTFPNCWDGTLPNHARSDVGDTTDQAHWRYKIRDTKAQRWVCPAKFGHRMIELRETIAYAYTGGGTNLKLTSDGMSGTSDGRSMHGDFWNAWEMPGFRSMVRNCIHEGGNYTAAACG